MSFKLYHFASLQYCTYSSTRFIVYLYSTGVGRFSILWGAGNPSIDRIIDYWEGAL